MINKISFLTTSKTILTRKLFACAVSFFIMISSFGVISEIRTNISLFETAKVSAGTVIAQFFYISTLPLNIISKLFTEGHDVNPLTPAENNKKKSKESNSSKASFGYSILPTTVNLLQSAKVKAVKVFVPLDKVKKSKAYAFFDNVIAGSVLLLETILKFNIIMILLLAILLTRRNVGDDNIVLNIKNNVLARLII